MKSLKLLVVGALIVGVTALIAKSVLADGPTGTSPLDPLMTTNSWLAISPQSTAWFYFDYGGDKSKIQIRLEDNSVDNVEFAIYTPQQAYDWIQDTGTKPIGRGNKQNSDDPNKPHDLVWQGSFNFGGRFYVAVSNNNSVSVKFRLSVVGDAITLYPTPTPTAVPTAIFSTPVPVGTVQGKLIFQQSSGGKIFTVNGDGSKLTPVSNGMDPAWSPDGTQIAFTRWVPDGGVYIANADGSDEVSLMGVRTPLAPHWSPDGTRIAFTRPSGGTQDDKTVCNRGFCFTQRADPHWKLGVIEIAKVIDADTTRNVLTEPPCTDHCFSPTWSADNHTIAYADAGVGLMTTDTLTRAVWIAYNYTPKVQSPAWSPDGTKIAFQVMQHDHWEIMVVNSDGTNPSPVTTPNPLAFVATNNVSPAWSPDSKQIIFLSDRQGKWEFFAANADGSNLRQVLKNVTDNMLIGYNFSNEHMVDWTR